MNLKLATTLVLALALSSCKLLPKTEAPVDAFVPRVSSTANAQAQRFSQLSLPTPSAPVYLDTQEPQLIDQDGSWQRIAGLRFAATPAELLQTLLADTLEQTGMAGAVVTKPLNGGARLDLELRTFALERSADGLTARLAFSARLAGEPAQLQRIDVSVPVAGLGSAAVREAWQAACDRAMQETLQWLKGVPIAKP